MPFIHIAMRKGTSDEHRRSVAKSVHRGMVKSMGIPEDDFFSVTHELDEANFTFDPNYYGLERSEKIIFVHFFFNARPATAKQYIFDTVVEELKQGANMRPEDIIMSISETAPENWWAYGRQTDPKTGTDARMGLK